MILSLVERLEQEGGGPGWEHAPPRWFGSAARPVGPAATTSGLLSTPSTLCAERTDDGVFVAAPSTRAQERIVWVGDLELDCATRPAAAFRAPIFNFHGDGLGLDLTWRAAAASTASGRAIRTPLSFRMRLTLPCRPTGELSFCNDDLDPEVWLSATRDGRMAARMRPYAALPELEIVPGSGTLAFEPAPDWRLGVEVMDSDGTLRSEDRFSPGTFLLELPPEESEIQLSIRIVASDAEERGRRAGALGQLVAQLLVESDSLKRSGAIAAHPTRMGSRLAPDELRLHALALPGSLLRRGAKALESASELRDLLIGAADHVQGPRFDLALWAARAAFLISPGPTRDVASVTLPFLRGVVGRIERDLGASGCPGAAAAGLPRWCSAEGPLGADQIPIEYAALLHQSCQHAADLAAFHGDRHFARRARQLTRQLRRWFQDAFWLARPERAADLASLAGGSGHALAGDSPSLSNAATWDRGRALCLRPHMLLAASFEGAPLSTAQRRRIVRATETRLLVPSLGIATLDCDDIEFDGHSAENGAIWPFLLGPFVEASLRAFGPDRGRHRALQRILNSQALESAPMAWAHSAGHLTSPAPYSDLQPVHSHRHPMPLGTLHFALNAAECARARCLLAAALPVDTRSWMSEASAGPSSGARTGTLRGALNGAQPS